MDRGFTIQQRIDHFIPFLPIVDHEARALIALHLEVCLLLPRSIHTWDPYSDLFCRAFSPHLAEVPMPV